MDSPVQLEERLRQQPDDGESWLVYADWLSERGDPRGELISLEHRKMTAEIAELTKKHQRSWSISDLPRGAQLVWRSGFVVSATFPYDVSTAKRLPALLDHPSARLLGELRLRFVEEEEEEEEAEEVFEDGYKPPPIDAGLLKQALAADLSRIRSLSFDYSVLGDEGADALVRSRLTALTALDLRYAGFGDAALEVLAGWQCLEQVATLKLQRNRFGARGARALADSPHLGQLTSLDLRHNAIGPEGANALARSPNVRRLSALYLYREDVGAEGAIALARSAQLPANLRRYWAALSSTHAA